VGPDTIREYALERLTEAGEAAQVRAAHARYYLDLAERAEPCLRGPDQARWLAVLRPERTNLLAALRFASDTGDADTAVRLGAALSFYWTIQGNHGEAASWLLLALRNPGDQFPRARTIATAFYLFNVVFSAGQGLAERALEDVRAWLRSPGHDADHPLSALIDAALALISNDTAVGLAAIDRRLPHADHWSRGMLLLMRAFLQGNAADMYRTRQTLAAAVAAFREADERWGRAMALTALAEADGILGDLAGAIASLQESIQLMRELDPDDDVVLQRVSLAVALAQNGEIERARADLLDLTRPGAGSGSARYLVLARISLGNLARHEDDLEEAARQYRAAADDLRRVSFSAPLFRATLGAAMGHLAATKGDLAAAERHLDEALRLAVEVPDMPVAATVGVAVARLRAQRGDAAGAAQALGAAHALRGAPDARNLDVARLAREPSERLGECAYERAYARGRAADRRGALALITTLLRP
jgi:tetratricopeptide (TPR) repeat protein